MNRVIRLFLSLGAFASAALNAADIDRVEPPFWWSGMEHSELQLMLHGEDIGELDARLEQDHIRIDSVQSVENPNYLFVNLLLDKELAPGQVRIQLHKDGEPQEELVYSFHSRRKGSAQRAGFDNADAIYLIAPDRFANGDPGNDSLPGLQEKANRGKPGGRHGGDLAGMTEHLDYIADMGFTAVWPMPMLENDQPEYSYHGYSTTDHYRVDPRFGSNEEYRQFSLKARAQGVGLIQDIILNHIGSEHWWMDDLPTSDWLNHQEGFEPTTHYRTGIQDPYSAEVDRREFTDGWFVETMPDLNQRNPLVANYLIQNSIWWVEYADLYGIRTDTYSYSDKHFLTEWTRRLMNEYPNFNIVGEEWSNNPNVVSYWQRGKDNADGYVSHLPSVMDFPLYENIRDALTEGEGWHQGLIRVYESLANDNLYPDPLNLVIFAENHDTVRLYSLLEEDQKRWQLAMALLATMRGIPQFFYASEILATSPIERNDGLTRSDFPGGWPGDEVNAFTGEGLSKPQSEAQAYLKKLLNWRQDKTVLHTGELLHFAPHKGVYVYFRSNADETVMVALNHSEETQTLDPERYREGLGDYTMARDVVAGTSQPVEQALSLPPLTARILELH